MRGMKIILAAMILFVCTGFYGSDLLGRESFLKTVVSINGKVSLEGNDNAVGLKIFILNENGKKIGIAKSNDIDGSYFVTGLRPGNNYFLSLEGNSIENKVIQIATPPVAKYTEILQDLYVSENKDNKELQSRK